MLMVENIDLATFRVFKQWNARSKSIRSEVSLYIEKQLFPFITHVSEATLANDSMLLFQTLIDKNVRFWDDSGTYNFFVQITVFHEKSGLFLSSFPEKFDEARQQLFFLGKYNKSKLEISDVIINIDTFFQMFGYFCFFCHKCFKGKGTQHKCSLKECCFACKRPFLGVNIAATTFNKKYFCLSSQQATVSERCERCNLRISSEQCRAHHFKKICRFGWLCSKCEKYTLRSRFLPSIESIAKNHICGVKLCHFCGLKKNNTHQCFLPKSNVSKSLTKLGFIDVQFTGRTSISCQKCFSKSKSTNELFTCEFCKDNGEIKGNVCTILYETEREVFAKKSFTTFSFPNQKVTTVNIPYLPPGYSAPPCEKKTFFNKVRVNRLSDSTFQEKQKGTKSVLRQMFDFLLKEKIMHTTFLIHDDENKGILNEVLKILISAGVLPHIIGTPHIRLLEIADMGLRFLNSTDYSSESHFFFFKKFHENAVFFPQKWNKSSFYQYVGQSPTISDLFNAEDTAEVIKEKEIFVEKKSTDKWSFKEEIVGFSRKRASIIARAFLSFVQEAFRSQDFLFRELQSTSTKKEFIMPFNPPLFTRASYAYALLLKFSSIEEIRTENAPIRMSSSKQEIEYCSFLRWQFPNYNFIDAWSPHGQKKYPQSFPDSFCENTQTAYYFNGCLVHGHAKEKCFFQRKSSNTLNYFNVPLTQACANHENKCKKIVQNNKDVLRTETMWECDWNRKKKRDSKVQYFMQNFYKEPPLCRLDSRYAVRGGINELYACHFRIDPKEQHCFSFADFISSYPHSAMGHLPLGEYEVC